MIEHAREILTVLAPDVDLADLTAETNLDELGLDRVTKFGLGVGLERALKIEIPDAQIMGATTLAEMVGDAGADDSPTPAT